MKNHSRNPFGASSSDWRDAFTRAVTLVLLYSAVLIACRYLAYEVRFDFVVPEIFQQERLQSLAIVLPIKLLFLLLFRQFGSLLTYFSVPDLIRITLAMGGANLTAYALRAVVTPDQLSPRGVVLTDFVLAVGALGLMRLGFRIYRERYGSGQKTDGRAVRRIVVMGAGDAGAEFVREALAKPSLRLKPVFFLDDDWRKHGHSVHGVQVLGAPEDIVRLRKDYAVEACVLAMPSAPGKRLQEIYKLLAAEEIKVEIVPSLSELASGRVQVTKIRPVQVEDLLGRASVDLRSPEVASLVQERVVMVTGAGGSIGSELCRQIATYNPQRLLMVEQSEGSLFVIESEMNDLGYRHVATPLVADILDEARMRFIFSRYQPSIVFHAAAHKHVFMMERQPGEAVKNNTQGTRQLAEWAAEYGVSKFVLISTDKAINPTSAMGATKRLAEMHLQALQSRIRGTGLEVGGWKLDVGQPSAASETTPNHQPPTDNTDEAGRPATRFIAVRFGNVLGSSGSVIPIFKQQIAAGGPVKVTHPDVTRYFMTIPEAVGLVLQTAVMGEGGEIFVLDMGKPVKIVDLARQLIELSGLRPEVDIEIKFIGLRPGEKLYEELQHHSEALRATAHPRIMLLANEQPHDNAWVRRCIIEVEQGVGLLEPNQLKLAIKALVPEYNPHLD
ncbi:MAG TPA: nucleoside-diphosphate sugar epimerase/dehydratase [Opitutaceae bacterium]